MKLLLDTHTLIWWLENHPRLGKAARKAIVAADERFISAVSAWEISVKISIGRLGLSIDPADSIRELRTAGFRPLPIDFHHAWALRSLPFHHADPFDRMLVAQAQCEGLTLVTADEEIPAYGIPVIDASR
jgi:PIN domain nuclease of toxin-antitoxin system